MFRSAPLDTGFCTMDSFRPVLYADHAPPPHTAMRYDWEPMPRTAMHYDVPTTQMFAHAAKKFVEKAPDVLQKISREVGINLVQAECDQKMKSLGGRKQIPHPIGSLTDTNVNSAIHEHLTNTGLTHMGRSRGATTGFGP